MFFLLLETIDPIKNEQKIFLSICRFALIQKLLPTKIDEKAE